MNLQLTSGENIHLKGGQSILDALRDAEIYLVASCGGKGTCGKCRVRIVDGSYKAKGYGKLTSQERQKGFVLACQTFALSDLIIEIPEDSKLTVGDKIAISRGRDLFELLLSLGGDISPLVKYIDLNLPPPTITDNIADLERLRRALRLRGLEDLRFSNKFLRELAKELRKNSWSIRINYTECIGCSSLKDRGYLEALFISPQIDEPRYGIAVDIGTTTIVVYLVNLDHGGIIDVASTYNSQIRFGDDVITRIIYATEKNGLEELRQTVVEDINTLTDSMARRQSIDTADILVASIAGNTTMSHIFWGLDPGPIREEPYIPSVNSFPVWRAGTAGLNINSQAPVYTLPCVASYVGGDIVAGVLASKMHRSPEISLFMDIGTNGEIVVGNNEWLMTAACSAGPCFEGSGIKSGMRATKGAIEQIRFNPETLEPEFSVIGNGKPIGICGSGMIDAISGMFLNGLIDQKGRFVKERSKRIREGEDGPEYVFYEEIRGDTKFSVVLTEPDIENIIRAKAAIYAGVSLLLKEAGLDIDSIQRVYIAGGFGNYLNPQKAIILGMLPDLPVERFTFLGNTSIAGAYLCLLSERMRKEAEEISQKMTYMELSVLRSFMDEYLSALFLPHTDLERFPSVAREISSIRAGR
ncbi:MAG: ASKHA domain-containing protein [Thermodesulfovibrionales bacterium]|nr:ASKHA domain-containing protein [Thermodesulfovibrionales bacterium]